MKDSLKIGAVCILLVAAASGSFLVYSLLDHDPGEKASIGIMWRPDQTSESFVYTLRAVEAAGGTPVKLDPVRSFDLEYGEDGRLKEGVDGNGILTTDAADIVKTGTWHNSNVEDVLKGMDFIIFPGGEDVCPSLYREPQEWHGIEEERYYSAERDVSDYIAMSYCLDNDIPFLGICRGMQVLAVVSGASMIQDIPTYFADMGIEYHNGHRNPAPYPGGYRDYAPHDVTLTGDSVILGIMGTGQLSGCPSWHHQGVRSIEGTALKVTGYTETDGMMMIEGLERTDKTCAFGIQYHPEAAVAKYLDDAPNKTDYMDYDAALAVFEWVVDCARSVSAGTMRRMRRAGLFSVGPELAVRDYSRPPSGGYHYSIKKPIIIK